MDELHFLMGGGPGKRELLKFFAPKVTFQVPKYGQRLCFYLRPSQNRHRSFRVPKLTYRNE